MWKLDSNILNLIAESEFVTIIYKLHAFLLYIPADVVVFSFPFLKSLIYSLSLQVLINLTRCLSTLVALSSNYIFFFYPFPHILLLLLFSCKLCPNLGNPMVCSTPGFPVLHYLPEFAQIHVHWVNDAIQSSHLLPPPSLFAFKLSQH